MSQHRGPIRGLHVDDDPDLAETAAAFLEREDDRFDVETATSARAGWDRLVATDGAFDCVVSDFDMPDRSGIAFLEDVRERYPDLPFVLFTGKGSEEVASDAISAGVTESEVGGALRDHRRGVPRPVASRWPTLDPAAPRRQPRIETPKDGSGLPQDAPG